jgi:hypothetical protein
LSVLKPIAKRIAATAWMQSAMNSGDDLHVFREKPALQVYAGMGLILISYVIGWPAVALLGLLALYTGDPLTLAIGGPLTYGLSHLVFFIGLYLAGKRYVVALSHWAARRALARFSGKED